jgi:hypothetical protein
VPVKAEATMASREYGSGEFLSQFTAAIFESMEPVHAFDLLLLYFEFTHLTCQGLAAHQLS